MRKLFLILTLAGGSALAQTTPPPEPAPPMVPTVRPPLGAASRAMRHELLAREREERVQEKAEDRAGAQFKRKVSEGPFKRSDK